MAAFIRTKDNEFLNADVVRRIVPEKGGFALITEERGYPGAASVMDTLVQIIPVQGDWQTLEASLNPEERLEVMKTAVVAWALTIDGAVVPVTGRDRAGVISDPAWQKVGCETVYVTDAQYATVELWAREHLKYDF